MTRLEKQLTTEVGRATPAQRTFSKRVANPDQALEEARRTEAARVVGRACGLFQVPPVINCDNGWITTQFVEGIIPLRTWIHRQPSAQGRRFQLAQVGTALGHFHAMASSPTQAVTGSGRWHAWDLVPIHGDFGLTNVQVDPKGRLTILDWAEPAWAPALGPRASSHWDLALLLVDLNYQRPRDPLLIPEVKRLSRAFLDGYRAVRGIDLGRLRRSVAVMTFLYYRGARGARRALRLPSSSSLLL